jgi:6-phosphofructokinase 2
MWATSLWCGGGGINVSKAISRLGGINCGFTAGGPTGEMIKDLLCLRKELLLIINISKWTRESFVAVDDNTNSQYRFGFPGSIISSVETEWFF